MTTVSNIHRQARLVGAFTLAVATSAGVSHAQSSSETWARLDALLAAADFDEAERAAQALLASGQLSRAEAARTHLALGVTAAGRHDAAAARTEFRRALTLTPDAVLSPAIGPQIAEVFDSARSEAMAADRSVPALELARDDAGALVVTLITPGSERELAAKVSVEVGGERHVFAWSEGERTPARWDPGVTRCQAATATITDEFGNALWPQAASLAPCPAEHAAKLSARPIPPPRDVSAPLSEPAHQPLPVAVWCGIAATSVLGVATVATGVSALKQRATYRDALHDGAHSLTEQWTLREEALGAAHLATTMGLITVIAGSATLVVYSFTRPRSGTSVSAVWRGTGPELDGTF